MATPQTAVAVIELFWARVDASGGMLACWPWLGGRDRSGYGKLSQGRRGTHVRANRFALELALGRPLGPGMQACHHCDNPPCVNPAHLFEGTVRDNLRDASAKGRTALQRHPEIARGERNSQSKLTTESVKALRAAARLEPMRVVAERFGISLAQAYRVASGNKWSHIPLEDPNA